MTDDLTDGELIRRFKDGDDSGFMRLVERYQDIMFRLSVGQGFDEEQAADITQEVFMRAWSRLRKWKPGKGKPFTWLYRTMMNIWSETRRKPRMVSGFSHPEHSELSTEEPVIPCMNSAQFVVLFSLFRPGRGRSYGFIFSRTCHCGIRPIFSESPWER